MENLNFWLCQCNYMGVPDGMPWIEATVPGTEIDTLYAQGGMVNDSGDWVWLTNHPQPICGTRARLFESSDPESFPWGCDCTICNGMI
jgi:hypothetical protein